MLLPHGIALWFAIGIVLGVGAKLLAGGLDLGSWLATIVCSITGAVVAGWLTAQAVGFDDLIAHYSLFAAVGGAVFVLWVLDTLAPPRTY